jgi:sugar-specific transcriptional regulator TrmB
MYEKEYSDLADFGFTSLQSMIYLVLLRRGTSRAGQISSMTGIVRPEVYRILHELESKGVVEHVLGSPSSYRAIPPGQSLSQLLEQRRKQLVVLEQKKNSLVESLESYSSKTEAKSDGEFRVIVRAQDVVSRIKRMLADVKVDYVSIMSRYGLRWVKDEGIARAVVSASRNNVRVRLISEIDESNVSTANYLSQHVELRHGSRVLFYCEIFDGKEMIFGPPITDEELRNRGRRRADIWTNDPTFIRGIYSFFEYIWDKSLEYTPGSNRGRI